MVPLKQRRNLILTRRRVVRECILKCKRPAQLEEPHVRVLKSGLEKKVVVRGERACPESGPWEEMAVGCWVASCEGLGWVLACETQRYL
jgi:hypothetical protein